MDAAFNLMGAADQGINVAFGGFDVQINAVFRERGFFLFDLGIVGCFAIRCACDGAGFAKCGVFGDAMRDKVDRVVTGHVLLLQEIGGVAFALGKDGDEHICACHFCTPR